MSGRKPRHKSQLMKTEIKSMKDYKSTIPTIIESVSKSKLNVNNKQKSVAMSRDTSVHRLFSPPLKEIAPIQVIHEKSINAFSPPITKVINSGCRTENKVNALKQNVISPEKPQTASVFLMDQHIKNVNPIIKDLLVPVRSYKKSGYGGAQPLKKCGRNELNENRRTIMRDHVIEDVAPSGKTLLCSTSKTKINGNNKRN